MRRPDENFSLIMKQYKWQIILSTILVLLPAAAGFCLLAAGAGNTSSEAGGIASSVSGGSLCRCAVCRTIFSRSGLRCAIRRTGSGTSR